MKIEIKTHTPQLAPYFKSLNIAWLEKFFVVEPIDEHVLSHPDQIIEQGGHISYLLLDHQVVGCCALKHHGKGVFELTKMAVTEGFQGKKLGHHLMKAAIQLYSEQKAGLLYLETNSILKPAIHLYEKFGFVKKPCPFDTPYQRSNYYMEWSPQKKEA